MNFPAELSGFVVHFDTEFSFATDKKTIQNFISSCVTFGKFFFLMKSLHLVLVFRFVSVKLFKTFYYYIFKFVINFSVIVQQNGFHYGICIPINPKLCSHSPYQHHTLFFYPTLLVSFLLEDCHLLLSYHIYANIVKYRFQTLEKTYYTLYF